jgi:Na+/melibiose symporter-like transporter
MEKDEFKKAMFWMVTSCGVLGACQTLFNISIY